MRRLPTFSLLSQNLEIGVLITGFCFCFFDSVLVVAVALNHLPGRSDDGGDDNYKKCTCHGYV